MEVLIEYPNKHYPRLDNELKHLAHNMFGEVIAAKMNSDTRLIVFDFYTMHNAHGFERQAKRIVEAAT